jgi:hypothetical protein
MGFLLYHDHKRSLEEYLTNHYLRLKLGRWEGEAAAKRFSSTLSR